jgi:hypothetical protein
MTLLFSLALAVPTITIAFLVYQAWRLRAVVRALEDGER